MESENITSSKAPKAVYLKNYRPPDYLIDKIDLRAELGERATTVISRLFVRRNPDRRRWPVPLVLDGQELNLQSIKLDGRELDKDDYTLNAESLTLPNIPDTFTLEIETRIKPQENTSLEGLYKSSNMFCTQCEAEGFRKITYYLDRPDVMARFTTLIIADKERYPVLLSNGNIIDKGGLPGNRHWVKWEDPFKKPCYLFALVAGDLVYQEDRYLTKSGRAVTLRIYVEPGNLDKCAHAMASLKHAVKWDEDTFGLEYDLDIYMIVAVGDFNMGAMENKGLNIFNTACVLAKPETASDRDYEGIQGVIGHEYFHNWTGNRVTCRDWFQLSLKEGLTVFRDQEFSSDMISRGVQRINDVRALRSTQFSEDAGPMAHPVRPDSYIKINNFYTATVYDKGAELVRMIHMLLGRQGFRKGMDLYFQRHDGQAVTTDNFVSAMADANGIDLTQFKRWYRQAGTPELTVQTSYNADSKTYTLEVIQSCLPTPGQEKKQPFHIPLAVGLLDRHGRDLSLRLAGEKTPGGSTTRVLAIQNKKETFRFQDVPHKPVPSLLRGFSAPVKLKVDLSDEELAFLAAHDSDEFNRWEAGQQLATRVIMRLIHDCREGKTLSLQQGFIDAMGKTLTNAELHKEFIAEALILPTESYLAELMKVIDVETVHEVRDFVRKALAKNLKVEFLSVYHATASSEPYHFDARSAARRSLKNLCLTYLMELDDPSIAECCMEQFCNANNMTDEVAALSVLANNNSPLRIEALDNFYNKWRHEPLVVDKWFAIQAASRLPGTLNDVKHLVEHPAFDLKNPNKVRSLIGTFCHANPVRFHAASGAGYTFLVDQVLELDRLNPQVAARLAGSLSRWKKYDTGRQALMKVQLERIVETSNLSKDVYEIASKSLMY